jgi:hypothetical protein
MRIKYIKKNIKMCHKIHRLPERRNKYATNYLIIYIDHYYVQKRKRE